MIYDVYWLGLSDRCTYSGLNIYLHYPETSYPYQHRAAKAVKEAGITGEYSAKDLLADCIKTTVGNSFVFVITKASWPSFEDWRKKHGLDRYVLYEMPDFITNGNHPGNGRNLRLVVMMTEDHPYRDLFRLTDEEIEEYVA